MMLNSVSHHSLQNEVFGKLKTPFTRISSSNLDVELLLKVFFTLFGLALTAPIEDTAEVKAARALFEEAFAKAEKGEHASLSPVQIQPTYLADTPEVSASKANFQAYFNAVELAAASPYIAPIQTYSNVGG